MLESGLHNLTGATQRFIRQPPEDHRRHLQNYRNSIKIYAFFLHWFITIEEKRQASAADAPAPTTSAATTNSRGVSIRLLDIHIILLYQWWLIPS
jgi:hypothetical protein